MHKILKNHATITAGGGILAHGGATGACKPPSENIIFMLASLSETKQIHISRLHNKGQNH
jgi:hypothetical protein